MTLADVTVVAPFAAASFFWIRGLWKQSIADLVLAAVVFVAATGCFAFLYPYTRFMYLPAIAMAVFAVAALVVLLTRRRRSRPAKTPAFCLVVAVCLGGLLALGERQWNAAANSLLVISPYRQAGTWVFDEPRLGLWQEPFVSGMPELIDKLVAEAEIPNADKGFRLTFSAKPFPDYQQKVVWRRAEKGGNWYYSEEYDMEGWLCPALFKFFRRPPNEIYVKAEAK